MKYSQANFCEKVSFVFLLHPLNDQVLIDFFADFSFFQLRIKLINQVRLSLNF